jgi:hypothetical protein
MTPSSFISSGREPSDHQVRDVQEPSVFHVVEVHEVVEEQMHN